MVYGMTIRIPGDFFTEPSITADKTLFISRLRQTMNNLKPVQHTRKNRETTFVHKDLNTSTHVFVRVDRLKASLDKPYEGPYPVKARTDKYYTLLIKGVKNNISIDRLKPAYILAGPEVEDFPNNYPASNTSPETAEEVPDRTTTRSGRTVRFPSRYLEAHYAS